MVWTIYHGSEKIIEQPRYGYGKKYNDYGLGFYCTDSLDMAKEYLKKTFSIGYNNYDAMIGYRADDSYFSFAQDFINGTISYRQLNNALYLGKLGQQFVLKSQKAFEQIRFVGYEEGDFTVLVGKSGVELAYDVVEQTNGISHRIKPRYTANRSEEYWVGWALAYYQWVTSLPFSNIVKYVSVKEIEALYSPYHEMDIRHFVDKMNELYRAAKPETNLKMRRM